MTTLNHALWGATIGRMVGLPIEGAFIASIPDLLTIPFFGYFKYKRRTQPENAPQWLLQTYRFLHNFFTGVVITILLFALSAKTLDTRPRI